MEPGPLNAITDVTGVLVGQTTVVNGDNVRTGVTAVLPHSGNLFRDKVPGAVFIGNAFGKLAGSTQVQELGTIESPIVLTNTLSVAAAMDATVRWTLTQPGNEQVRSVNALVGETNDGGLNDIRGLHVTREHVTAAITGAKSGDVSEGAVGAGTGTVAFGWKGGIGTSSRRVRQGPDTYTVGVLVESHRRHIAVLFCDLRGFTAFSETAEPEEVMGILQEYHQAVGGPIAAHEGTVEHFAGDGLMIFFNDPLPCPEPEMQAIQLAMALRACMSDISAGWRQRGYDLGFGMGVAAGYATLGCIGFAGRFHYGAIGSTVNLAARLCDEARDGQVLLNARTRAAVGDRAEFELLPDLTLKGFSRPVRAFKVVNIL